MWPKDGGLANTGMTWSDALQAAISLNSGSGLCGYKDWHLPNEKELHSLVGGYADPTYALPKGHPLLTSRPTITIGLQRLQPISLQCTWGLHGTWLCE